MEVVLSIVFIVAGISIYEFYSARSWQKETSITRNNLVFENRNQDYGAYILRRDYNKSMVYIMLGVILSMGLIFGTFQYFKAQKLAEVVIPIVDGPNVLIDNFQKDEPPLPEHKKTVAAVVQKTEQFIEPKPVDKPEVEKVLTAEELEKLKVGAKKQGTDTAGIFVEPVKIKENVKKDPIIIKEVIPDFTDIDASFPNLVPFIQKRLVYPQIAIEEGREGKCYLKFVVNLDGTVSDVSVVRGVPDCPECDKEAVRVIRQMKDWTPGVNQGKQVRSWMSLPINFTLQ
ncbi:MAG: TonB family protein [Bacteroidota bacterium]